MQCNRCGKEINPAKDGRWSLPKGAGVETVCVPCANMRALDVPPGAVLIDKDGRETPIDVEEKKA